MHPPIRKAVFPAAGLGTRFLPATKATPKEMLPVVDVPLIQYAIEEVADAGVDDVIVVTGRGKRAIEDHFDLSFELDYFLEEHGKSHLLDATYALLDRVQIGYVRQRRPQGLGHAVACARRLVGGEPFAVVLADDLIYADPPCLAQMARVYEAHGAPVVAVQRVPEQHTGRYGIVDAEPAGERTFRVRAMVEKPDPAEAPSNLAIVGRYILTPEIFDELDRVPPGSGGEIQLTDALVRLLDRQPIYAYEFEGTRYDAGDKLGFLQATVEYALRNETLGPAFRAYLKRLAAEL
ncbi:MAG: UTP--glucose-1-phosphate uridylyltransferase [Nitrospirae bacterium]|nr:MAG: UTP--glucose-1-phosphate uridylyltransferase [Nitrospirota bacterium]